MMVARSRTLALPAAARGGGRGIRTTKMAPAAPVVQQVRGVARRAILWLGGGAVCQQHRVPVALRASAGGPDGAPKTKELGVCI